MNDNCEIPSVIIEDNIECLEYISSIITLNFPQIQILGIASSITKSIELINKINPELIFMDIELIDGNSFEIFKKIFHQNFEVIFITAHDGFMKRAIDHYAFSYIVKPYTEEKLVGVIDRYLNLKKRLFSTEKINLLGKFLETENSCLLLHIGNEHISIKTSEIIKCEANGNYTDFYMSDEKHYMASNILKYYEDLLTEKGFFKPHRSTLINIQFIKSIYKKETIILKNKESIPVSIRNKPKLTSLIKTLS